MRQGWRERERPPRLERRYEFSDNTRLRDFLDRTVKLSEREGLYPKLDFWRDYLNVTIQLEEGQTLSERERGFAAQLDRLHEQVDRPRRVRAYGD